MRMLRTSNHQNLHRQYDKHITIHNKKKRKRKKEKWIENNEVWCASHYNDHFKDTKTKHQKGETVNRNKLFVIDKIKWYCLLVCRMLCVCAPMKKKTSLFITLMAAGLWFYYIQKPKNMNLLPFLWLLLLLLIAWVLYA